MEEVWEYPRPPALEPCPRRVRIELGGVVVANSVAALRVLETSHPPTIYVPPGDIVPGALRPAAGSSFCEWKGSARYYDVAGGERVEARAAWAYAAPVARYAALRDHVAFYPSRLDALLARRRARAIPGGGLLRRVDHGRPPGPVQGRARDAGLVAPTLRRMPDRAETLKKLDQIRIIAVVDLVMLIVLLYFAATDNAGVSILGPIHGLVVLVLLALTAFGVTEKRWGWIFPVTTLIPIFALFYDQKLRREVVAR